QLVQVLAPNGFERFEEDQSILIEWRTVGLTGTVDIDLIDEFSALVVDIADVAYDHDSGAGAGTYSWPISLALSDLEKEYRIRVTANSLPGAPDESDELFIISNDGTDYYINDDTRLADDTTNVPGDNAFSGKTKDYPMASLRALLMAYDLDSDDTIHVDNGSYHVLNNIVIQNEDSDFTIEGYNNVSYPSRISDLDRNNTNRNVFDISTNDITLNYLHITGGYGGVDAVDADDLTVSYSRIYGNVNYGIELDAASERGSINNSIFDGVADFQDFGIVTRGPQPTIDTNTVNDHLYDGIYVDWSADGAVVNNNEVYGSRNGIYVDRSSGAVLTANQSHNNSNYGIYANGSTSEVQIEVGDGTALGMNISYDNAKHGIYANSNVRVWNNLTYGQTGTNDVGIYLVSGAIAELNEVHSNDYGILGYTYSTVTIKENAVYNNAKDGIAAYNGSIISGNKSYSNSIGVQIHRQQLFSGKVENNLVYDNTNQGIVINYAGGSGIVTNNTIYQEVGDALRVQDSSQNTRVRNNIFWVEAGYAIYVDTNSLTGFDSDRNLFQIGGGIDAHLGYWDDLVYNDLATWQGVPAQDPDSREGTANFADPDGADGILGYSTVGDGYDGGPDDNFSLTSGSPAIDHADSFAAPRLDILGNPRWDDPGTSPNTGSSDYVENNLGSMAFGAVGVAKSWRSDNGYWSLPLLFNFNFYGVNYASVYVSANGFLQFGNTTDIYDATNSTAELLSHKRIAPLWDDLKTNGAGDDIFVDESVANQVTIRWDATNKADSSDVNFSVTLYDNGDADNIHFDYGTGNTSLSPTVGISAGDNNHYLIGAHNTLPDLNDADTLEYDFEDGFADIGAYEFLGDSGDTTPPTVVSIAPPEIGTSGTASLFGMQIQITFSEPLNDVAAGAITTYDLRAPGLGGAYDDGNDIIYDFLPIIYTTGSTLVTIPLDAGELPFPAGEHRFTIYDSLRDQAGNRLDGDEDTFEGGDYVRIFQVDTAPPTVASTEINNGAIQRSTIYEISVTFDEDVTVTQDALTLYNDTTTASVNLAAALFSYDGGTFTATWDLSGVILEDGNHTATVVATEVTDSHLNNLDGDEDGIHGDDYAFTLHRLLCDANGDRKVDIADHDIWLAGYDPLGHNSNDPGNGDWNLDDLVDGADLELWMQNYDDVGLPTPPPSSPPPPEAPPAPPPEGDAPPPPDETPPPPDDVIPPQDDPPPETDEKPQPPGRDKGLDHQPDRSTRPDRPRRKAFNTNNLSKRTSIYDGMPQEYELLRADYLFDEPDAIDVLVDTGVAPSEPSPAQVETVNIAPRKVEWFWKDHEPAPSENIMELLRPDRISPDSLFQEEVEEMTAVPRDNFLALDPIDRIFLGAE
ncbi:right-handed parallel beta-helix repeat-containing protein, partial [Planctomycetota bacterium]